MQVDDQSFLQALEAIRGTNSIDHLNTLLRCLTDVFGVENFAYHARFVPGHVAEEPLLLVTYENHWIRRYISEDYFRVDPVEVTAGNYLGLIDWEILKETSRDAGEFFRNAERFGVGRSGVSFAVGNRFGGRGLFSVTSNETGPTWNQLKKSNLHRFFQLANALHKRTTELARGQSTYRFVPLTRREQFFLTLYIQGHEPKQICWLASVSETTVRDAFKAVCKKLGATNTRHAGYLALSLGIIPASKVLMSSKGHQSRLSRR
jgi:DNA-binding CsgD family transcriptional regulator